MLLRTLVFIPKTVVFEIDVTYWTIVQ